MADDWKKALGGIDFAGLGAGLGGLLSGGGAEWDASQGVLSDLYNGKGEAGPSAYGTVDPTGRNAQLDSLAALKSIAGGGMRPEDRAMQTEAMNASNRNEQGQRGAITQGFANRGMSGSGAEMATQLANEQGSANRNAMAGMTAAGNASQRALQAIAAQGSMGGQVRGQDLTQAGGQDAMARFNAGQRVKTGDSLASFYGGKAGRKQEQGSEIGSMLGGLAGIGMGFL